MAYFKEAENFLAKLPSISLEGMEPLGPHSIPTEQMLTVENQGFKVSMFGYYALLDGRASLPGPLGQYIEEEGGELSLCQLASVGFLSCECGHLPHDVLTAAGFVLIVRALCLGLQAQPGCFAFPGFEHLAAAEQKNSMLPANSTFSPNSTLFPLSSIESIDSGSARSQVSPCVLHQLLCALELAWMFAWLLQTTMHVYCSCAGNLCKPDSNRGARRLE